MVRAMSPGEKGPEGRLFWGRQDPTPEGTARPSAVQRLPRLTWASAVMGRPRCGVRYLLRSGAALEASMPSADSDADSAVEYVREARPCAQTPRPPLTHILSAP